MKKIRVNTYRLIAMGVFSLFITACGGQGNTQDKASNNYSLKNTTAVDTEAASIVAPLPATTLSSSIQEFTWDYQDNDVNYWAFYAGSKVGGYDYYSKAAQNNATHVTAANLPTNGSTIYVRLWYRVNQTWKHIDTTYIAATIAPPQLLTPVSETILTGSTQAFTWDYSENDVNYWAFYAGSTVGGYDYFSRAAQNNDTHVTGVNLPTDGSTIYIRLWYRVGQIWQWVDTTYTAATITPPEILTPTAGTVLSDSTQEFTWDYHGNDVNHWVLYIGSTTGGYDYYSKAAQNNATQVTAVNLPTDGSTVYVRLWYRVGQDWKRLDTTYTAATITPPEILTPAPAATLSASTQAFTWDYHDNNVNYWAFYAGSKVGGYDYYSKAAQNNATQVTAVNLPTDGSTIYIRLWYKVGQNWKRIDTTYTAANQNPDADNDTIPDALDNCPATPNQDQLNTDGDEQGNACDTDDDNDGLTDEEEADGGTNPLLADTDGDNVNDNEDDFPLDATKITTYSKAYRLLTQASFGATATEIQQVMSMGITAWVDAQLSSLSAYDSNDDAYKTHLQRVIQLALTLKPNANWNEDAIFNKPLASTLVDELQMTTWWDHALRNPDHPLLGSDPLRQRVAYALSQILVVSNGETPLHRRGESLAFYYDILGRNAFGNYRTILSEVSRSPAMGIYLSHQGNKKANLASATVPDENYARELIQLFSLGLHELNLDGSPNRDGNANTYPDAGTNLVQTYTQNDVSEMAKVMTGWDLADNNSYGESSYRKGNHIAFMEFTPAEHEDEVAESGDGMVTVLGNTFALNSGADGSGLDAALDTLFQHDNIAPFISRHLIMRLVTSNPTSGYVARVAAVFNNNGQGVKGDLKAVVRAILLDQEARSEDHAQSPNFGKVKEPILALTQFLRAFNVRPLDGWILGNAATSGVYWYAEPEKHFGQAPLRSPSVFNFYAPDFTPVDDYFAQNKLAAPELQIQSNHILLEMSNSIASIINTFEKNKIEKLDKKTLAEHAARFRTYNRHVLLIDFDKEMEVYEQALDGDTNGDFVNMELTDPATNTRYKDQAITALLDHLDHVLLGGTMTEEYHAALKHFLLNAAGTKSNNDVQEAWLNIKDAVRFIVTSNAFMIQK